MYARIIRYIFSLLAFNWKVRQQHEKIWTFSNERIPLLSWRKMVVLSSGAEDDRCRRTQSCMVGPWQQRETEPATPRGKQQVWQAGRRGRDPPDRRLCFVYLWSSRRWGDVISCRWLGEELDPWSRPWSPAITVTFAIGFLLEFQWRMCYPDIWKGQEFRYVLFFNFAPRYIPEPVKTHIEANMRSSRDSLENFHQSFQPGNRS